MSDPNARAITVTATATPAACTHPEQARTTRTDHGSYDYIYDVCAACASERLTCQDDDDCGICIDGGKWQPILNPEHVPAGHLEAAGLADASETEVDAYLEGRYEAWKQAAGEADMFPLTCAWCRKAPATRLLIWDVLLTGKSSPTRQEHMLCAPCAHQSSVLPPSFVGWWLFELVPDHCEEG